jgi:hypothetical protein
MLAVMWSFVPDRVTLKAETLHLALSLLPHRTPDIVTRSRVEVIIILPKE